MFLLRITDKNNNITDKRPSSCIECCGVYGKQVDTHAKTSSGD